MILDGQPLRVLMLITNLGQGGAERVFHDHATAFAKRGLVVEQAVFAGDYPDAYQTQLPLHQLFPPLWLTWFGAIGRLFGRALALRRLVASGRFDVVVSHMDGANWVNVLSGAQTAKILVVHGSVLHDQNQFGWRQWLRLRFIIPILYNRADATVSVSEGIGRELIGLNVARVQAIPNFFDVQRIAADALQSIADTHRGFFESGPVLVSCGRLSRQKNQQQLLHLFAAIRKRRKDVKLVILGDGELRRNLLEKCSELGLSAVHPWGGDAASVDVAADVLFLGYQTNPFSYLALSRLFLFPSSWEGFPLALCEAMACGVPVLSADCPTGPREILDPIGGTTTMPATIAEFTSAGVLLPMLYDEYSRRVWLETVLKLLDSPTECESLIQGAHTRVQQLDREVVLGRWIDLLHDAVEQQ